MYSQKGLMEFYMPQKIDPNRYRIGSRSACMVLLVVLVPLLFACAQQVAAPLPGIKAGAKGVYHPGRFVWFELLTENGDAGRGFYSELFGWTFSEAPGDNNYSYIVHNGKEIGGMLSVAGNDKSIKESRWICSISVHDVDQAAKEVTRLGGKVLYGPVDSGDRGRLAQVADSQGADFVVLRSLQGDPDRPKLAPGEPVWVDLFTKNKGASESFYKDLLGYSTVQSGKDTDHFYFVLDKKVKAGLAPVEWEDLESTWLPYIGVGNLRKKVLKAIDLGGTLLAHTETAAVVLDPGGAAIGLQLVPEGGKK